MRVFVTCDIDAETKVDSVVYEILNAGLAPYFEQREYGGDFRGIVVVLMCRDPAIEFKRRVRYSKKDKLIYMDILLDYQFMVSSDQIERRRAIAKQLLNEIPAVLSKYEIVGFDRNSFVVDFSEWIHGLGWG
jgi:hypothetical protein